MLQSVFGMVEQILTAAGADPMAQDIVSAVFDGVLKILGM